MRILFGFLLAFFAVTLMGATSTFKPKTSTWAGQHESDCAWTFTSVGSYSTGTGDSTCTFTERVNSNMGSVTSATDGNNLPGIVFTPRNTGNYLACATIAATVTSGIGRAQLTDGTNVLAQVSVTATQASGVTVCGILPISSTSAKTLRVQGGVTTAVTLQVGGNTAAPTTRAVDWTITGPL